MSIDQIDASSDIHCWTWSARVPRASRPTMSQAPNVVHAAFRMDCLHG